MKSDVRRTLKDSSQWSRTGCRLETILTLGIW